jgi:hypothetical protein
LSIGGSEEDQRGGVVRTVARIVGAVLTVAVGAAVNQVLNGGKWNWWAAGISVVLVIVAGVIDRWLAHRDGAAASAGVRWRTYLRQLRSTVEHMETIGLQTQSEFVLGMKQVQ